MATKKQGTTTKKAHIPRRAGSKRERSSDDASLFPLSVEDAIKAVMDAGPHPTTGGTANRRRIAPTPKTKERPVSNGRVHKGKMTATRAAAAVG